jgi:hypothetical protein
MRRKARTRVSFGNRRQRVPNDQLLSSYLSRVAELGAMLLSVHGWFYYQDHDSQPNEKKKKQSCKGSANESDERFFAIRNQHAGYCDQGRKQK